MNQAALSSLIGTVADRLRGDYKQTEYGKVILSLTLLRRLDCVLGPTEVAVWAETFERLVPGINAEPFPLRKAGLDIYDIAPMDMTKLMGDPEHVKENLFT